MIANNGKCSCGQVKFNIFLPEHLAQYTPRACDCEFCTSRNIVYLSHPKGELEIETQVPLAIQRQGSNQAGFITCSNCKSVIAATLQLDNQLLGALNSTLLLDHSSLQKAMSVSPKVLDEKEKVERWQSLWLKVKVNGSCCI